MCNFNLSCQVLDGSCDCVNKHSLFIPPPVVYQPFIPNQNLFELTSIYRLVASQNQLLQIVHQSISLISSKISLITPQNDELTTPAKLLPLLTGPKTTYSYFLRLLDSIPKPVYKERAFSFSLVVADNCGKSCTLPQSLLLEIELFTADDPPERVDLNTSGEKVARFVCEDLGGSLFKFSKVRIQEVTSHYRNGSLFLVVVCKNNHLVQPLIVEEFIVKARKILSKKPEKKINK